MVLCIYIYSLPLLVTDYQTICIPLLVTDYQTICFYSLPLLVTDYQELPPKELTEEDLDKKVCIHRAIISTTL